MHRTPRFTLMRIVIGLALLTGMARTVVAQRPLEQLEPQAGTWKTWVLASGSQLRLPAPPDRAATAAELKQLKDMAARRDAATLDQIAYCDTGAPSYRWNEIAVNECLQNNLAHNMAARHLALMHVAIYDALIAAWDSKYSHHRPRPSEVDPSLTTVIPHPPSPSYPSEYATVAGVASAVLAYVFPDRAQFFLDKAAEAGHSRLLAGVEYPSDVQAGLELGRKVAALVIARGQVDGLDAKWTGSVPTEQGKWTGTDPILPLGGTWKTWVLTAPDEFRPGPPPTYNSPQAAAELAEVVHFKRTPKHTADAFFWEYAVGGRRNYWFWNEVTGKKIFEYRLDSNPPRAARVYALASIASHDATVACWDAKYAYWAIRPFQLDPSFKPLFTTPNHPGYPSAHSCASSAPTTVLAYLFPRDAATLNAMADQAGESRIWAGIHFRSDVDAGLELGQKVARKIIEHAQSDSAQGNSAPSKGVQ
jgi:membrane-associated phospholipid phosphatase